MLPGIVCVSADQLFRLIIQIIILLHSLFRSIEALYVLKHKSVLRLLHTICDFTQLSLHFIFAFTLHLLYVSTLGIIFRL